MLEYPFPVNSRNYFRLRNNPQIKAKFLNNEIIEPTFEYVEIADIDTVRERIKLVAHDQQALQNLQLVELAYLVRKDTTMISLYRTMNERLYSRPRLDYVDDILSYFATFVRDDTREIWSELEGLLGHAYKPSSPQFMPKSATFETYHAYLKNYISLPSIDMTPIEAINYLLNKTGLSQQGWCVVLAKNATHARTNHRLKKITIGEQYKPRKKGSARRIAVHEVLGHASRGPQATLSESEGFAILLEQLTLDKFTFKRSYRYLAAAFAWGTLGEPLTFRGTYERLWRIMAIGSAYGIDESKSHAYNECLRIFRGALPDIAGAVFLKDATYFDANIRMWQILEQRSVKYNEFIDYIKGRATVLK